MANKTLFNSSPAGPLVAAVDAVNEAGGAAYRLSPRAALAQYAATGCLNATFYASAGAQLKAVLDLCAHPDVSPEYIARVALFARSRGHMKDLPALLCAVLASFSPGLLAEVFDRVIDDGRMLRNFVQIVRSGVAGRKSLGTLPKRLVQDWFDRRTDEQVFRASIGNDPSLADVVRLAHPRPATPSRAALYAYLIGRPHDAAALPALVRQFEAFKAGEAAADVPDVPFQMLTALDLSVEHWREIARNAPWQATRMNLNAFARHGVFADRAVARAVADKLRDERAVERSRVLPYQLMVAYRHAGQGVPADVREALQDAMEIATRNVPAIDGKVYVCPDVSGSMQSPVTGHRAGATTAVRCLDVAALVAACFLRTNRSAEVIPFSDHVVPAQLNPRDSVISNAQRLASLPSGGTNCSAPLAWLNDRRATGDLVVFVSDNESWVDAPRGRGTETMRQWAVFKARNPRARLACVDVQPYATAQASEQGRDDVLNVGGFSDHVFELIAQFAQGTLNTGHWVGVIEAVSL